MGITTRTVTVCTCDVCQRECQPDEGRITIEVNGGDGRDVGPATINGMLTFYQPYGCDKGVVCTSCKLKWLRHYVDSHPTPHRSVSMTVAAQEPAANAEALLDALRQIAEWPDGGERYGQEKIKRFAQHAIDAAMAEGER